MKITTKFTLVFLILFLVSFKQDNLPKTFEDLLNRANMSFQVPPGLEETEIIENGLISYDYAIKYPNKKFEVRYAVRPLDSLVVSFKEKEKNKKRGEIIANPNKLMDLSIRNIIFNITGENNFVVSFDKRDVKKEFNANWGASNVFEVGTEFGKGYNYCYLVLLHKDNFADVYMFYLFDKKEGVFELIEPIFHALKFKKK